MISALGRGEKDRAAALRPLSRFKDPSDTATLLDAARKRTGSERAVLLRVLGDREQKEVLALLLESARDPSQEVRIAAIEGLSSQKDPAVLAPLLEAAESGPQEVRPIAVLGSLRFGKTIEAKEAATALKIYTRALELSPKKEDRLQAIDGLARLKSEASLGTLKPLLADRDRETREHAAQAILPVAASLPDVRKDEAIEILKTAIPLAPSSPAARTGTARLRALGVEYDVAREAGFITQWWLAGPFPNPENKTFRQDLVNPDAVDLTASLKAGETQLSWKAFHTADAQGTVNLEEAVARQDWVGAYAYAEITSPDDKRVTLRMGSDDSIEAWLNGKKIHDIKGSRGHAIDQDQVNTRLAVGKNRILVKVLNEGAQWAFSLRITDRQGAPLKLPQKEK